MKIYTKTGDKGTTSLVGGTRVSKTELRIEAYGTVDELNSYIGLVRDQTVNEKRKNILKEIQDRLFTIGSILASEPEQTKKRLPDLLESDIELLENEMDTMDHDLEPMRYFILPGGHQSVSFGHLARTVCRRAERIVLRLSEESEVNDLVIRYLNRLSDYIFVLCRMMAKELGIEEVAWKPRVSS
ncbi:MULTISPECIES: cob(I)yrinic acid a,c-diamide adenosyltransferase [unclassified Arcicella]|uniref:cob(I)yrinic acid a,c-diamide adenosyltransferase n=1 Tax=unclassified Arcicella TaxID=2644986 RepID=UPI0028674267|nr:MULTISPECIES: cob(I)yrinic acid a,c-diamide adenosyltransferase [unclassified Arcicella]MDR6564305.1 cob(I)alamin adenosyltransferase [Arcicella sp. BE51]MDR6814056.1 cob(I)alamin adenosyltransferase [Arcicella sp. BE140]MDR6825368.1 cob(I)alamin adenosyltransferase [Arcicella sp. BE139]